MHDLVPARPRPRVRRTAGTALAVLVLAAGGCTGDDATAPSPAPSTTPSRTGAAGPASQPAEPVAVDPVVRVTRVAGWMRPRDREVLADNVGKVLSAYVDAAYLRGDYPRSSFAGAFDAFTGDAARMARRDQDLLTNAVLAPTTVSVVPQRLTAYLNVLSPKGVAAGVTARLRLRYTADRGDLPGQDVTVSGRLLLTRHADGGWRIFGYDLTRSVSPAREES